MTFKTKENSITMIIHNYNYTVFQVKLKPITHGKGDTKKRFGSNTITAENKLHEGLLGMYHLVITAIMKMKCDASHKLKSE